MQNKQYTLAQIAAIYTVYKDLSIEHTVTCCTCGKSIYIANIEDCYSLYGHYIPRSIEPSLKFHPNNTFAQCVRCNMNSDNVIDTAYDKYMIYRFGKDIKTILLSEKFKYSSNDETKNFYLNELAKLSQKFPELLDVIVNKDTGEISEIFINDIEKQWNTFSKTYRQDLDILSKAMGVENVEYERF